MIGLDYETWSDVNLPVRGLDNYVKSPNFGVLLASVALEDGRDVTFDFVFDEDAKAEYLSFIQDERQIIAHNAPFERAVTNWLDQSFPWQRILDSAVYARMLGAESKLEVASRQLTNSHKLEVGANLVMLFCVPNEHYPEMPTAETIRANDHLEEWKRFREYCEMDARGSLDIRKVAEEILGKFDYYLLDNEDNFEQATFEMNQNGWYVDRKLVEKMKQRAWANTIIAKRAFTTESEKEVNFNSPLQLKKYCEDRGVKVKSLDKYQLPLTLQKVKERIAKLDKQVGEDADGATYPQLNRAITMLREVESLLETKLEIGGSTLTKLPTILNLVGKDDVLRDQYVHIGAGQTFRTTGRGVQMQNLKKLADDVRNVESIHDLQTHWSNGDMANQLRQVFTSRHPDGEIIVGDFSAVESRGLAYEAGEEWKLDAYREGKDVYKVLVTKYLGIDYEDVTKELRPRGKYSELSCGYQASAGAVQDFMFKLGFSVSIEDAAQNVEDWRGANPKIIEYWHTLDSLLKSAVRSNTPLSAEVGYGLKVKISPFILPSMAAQHPGAVSLCIQLIDVMENPYVTRFIHGCYFKEKTLCYYKSAERLSQGELWKATYIHPKTKRKTYYSIYGGKLAGILTQSLCRELFFDSLADLRGRLANVPNALIVGQFHDEIAVDWWPGEYSKEQVMEIMEETMNSSVLPDFPLDVDIKSSYRYIK